ncbi:hypothetical protein ACFWWM_23850 [Streptomyces sp. NPDC058682]|uniref:hypothetical protein n=1 Tax=unclassified Streptomyces TaxID=2593676 RepID=UPI002255B477|nr:hypothetical protein [Streptomyces sp. NBC_01214]MCX4808536.1 hypothetical protein [Streptomyces sp. NBC_01214]
MSPPRFRTTKARLKEITACGESPDSSPAALKLQAEDAALAEEQAAAAVGRATLPKVAPFLAARDDLQRRGEDVLRHLQHAEYAIKLQSGLEKRAALVERHEMQIARLREERDRLGDAAQDRDLIIGRISGRYNELLRQWRYPKFSQSMVDTNLTRTCAATPTARPHPAPERS